MRYTRRYTRYMRYNCDIPDIRAICTRYTARCTRYTARCTRYTRYPARYTRYARYTPIYTISRAIYAIYTRYKTEKLKSACAGPWHTFAMRDCARASYWFNKQINTCTYNRALICWSSERNRVFHTDLALILAVSYDGSDLLFHTRMHIRTINRL